MSTATRTAIAAGDGDDCDTGANNGAGNVGANLDANGESVAAASATSSSATTAAAADSVVLDVTDVVSAYDSDIVESPMRAGCIAHQRHLMSSSESHHQDNGNELQQQQQNGGGSMAAASDDAMAVASNVLRTPLAGEYVGTCARSCGGGGSSGSDVNAWARLTEQQLRELVQEMATKMEYTERMNWLCLSSRPKGPPHRKTSLPNHKEVKARFLQICDQTLSDEIKAALRLPTFDSYEWSDEAVLHLMQTMFIDCGFVDKFHIPLPVLREWLYEVYKHYNLVPFHNFRHCFCVAQMMYSMAWHTNLMARLGDLEVLILIVSCICHDLDHPGYNNIYQINARTELALRYNDISPLENHHCSIAFRLLEHPDCNIFQSFSKEAFREIREGIIRCILATDMARHNDILGQFQEVLPHFDYGSQAHINVFCMILIKVADISNESRPMNIAEPWLERLFQEFFAQSAIEKAEGLPVTPFMDPDKVSKPGSQVRFIGLVLLPLFESLGELLPELNELIIHPVRVAFDYYKCLNDAQIRPRKSHCEVDDSSDGTGSAGTSSATATAAAAITAAANQASGGTSVSSCAAASTAAGGNGNGTAQQSGQLPRSHSGVSLKSRRSMPSQKSMSKNSMDEPMCISAELHDLPEGSESGDSETATEVEVAEKSSKFKINSEGNSTGRSMHLIGNMCGSGNVGGAGGSSSANICGGGGVGGIGSNNNNININKCSRKESRRKRPSMISEMYTASFGGGKARGSYGNIHSSSSSNSGGGVGGSGCGGVGCSHSGGHYAHGGRCHFGSSGRAQSLDQYNSRRLSDGVHAIVADENAMCFQRQHRSLDNEAAIGGGGGSGSGGSGAMIGADKYISSDSCAIMTNVGGGGGGGGSISSACGVGANKVQPLGSSSSACCQHHHHHHQLKTAAMASGATTSTCASICKANCSAKHASKNAAGNPSRSLMSTLRQLKDSFHFSFERDIKKRMSGGGGGGGSGTATTTSTDAGASGGRNNNAIDYGGHCCAHAAAAAAAAVSAGDSAACAGDGQSRNRACSLDVPARMWYNTSNGNGNGSVRPATVAAVGGQQYQQPAAGVGDAASSSRKSSSRDDDQNSNRTLSDPLQLRGSSSLDGDGGGGGCNRSDGTTSI